MSKRSQRINKMQETLITEAAARLIHEVQLYLESEVNEVVITDESQKIAATLLGNELQKKFRLVEDTRKSEKSVWDQKAKLVQEEFKPILDKITEKKNNLSKAVAVYNIKIEQERKRLQFIEDERVRKIKEKQEAEARRLRLIEEDAQRKAAEARRLAEQASAEEREKLTREAEAAERKAAAANAKVEMKELTAAQSVSNIIQNNDPASSKGTRKTMKATVSLIDINAFVAWCAKNDECQFLLLDESKVKARIKEKEGKFSPPGLSCSYTEETGFSGR